jgi:hypothetical protein
MLRPFANAAHSRPVGASEDVLARISGTDLAFDRYLAAPLAPVFAPSGNVVMGPVSMVTTYVLAATAADLRARTRAEQWAAPQWRRRQLLDAVLTTRSISCLLAHDHGADWLRFDHATIAHVALHELTATFHFHGSEPLRLTGDPAPFVAVVAAHHAALPLPTLMPPRHAPAPRSRGPRPERRYRRRHR